ncbi:type II secretion system protein N [Motilimonas pumila]|uniref:Type II secretion system protein N n=1 Tax=Motilimonas pumila TaxID=2303987 RepID=A0A418YKV8_9GAMM|nr:type II secretion system protein N [Motilimonas pumila]RJG51612.1 type II secretion system protein N [Motilimonas pumila]
MKIKLILMCIVAYLVFLVVKMPASFALQFLPESSGVKLSNVSGSIWQGRASSAFIRGETIDGLEWQIKPFNLFWGSLAADVKFGSRQGIAGEGGVSYGLSGASASDLNITMPASKAMKYITLPMPIKASGMLDLTLHSASQGTPFCSDLDGVLFWTDADVKGPMGQIALGDPKVKLGCDQGGLTGIIDQKSDHLNLNAKAFLADVAQYRVEGELTPGKSLDPKIAQGLPFIGEKTKTGSFLIKLNTIKG